MTHRLINIALVIGILLTMVGIQVLDASDLESELQTEQREWMFAVQHCLRTYGVQSQPEYDENDRLICRTRRGEALPYMGNT